MTQSYTNDKNPLGGWWRTTTVHVAELVELRSYYDEAMAARKLLCTGVLQEGPRADVDAYTIIRRANEAREGE